MPYIRLPHTAATPSLPSLRSGSTNGTLSCPTTCSSIASRRPYRLPTSSRCTCSTGVLFFFYIGLCEPYSFLPIMAASDHVCCSIRRKSQWVQPFFLTCDAELTLTFHICAIDAGRALAHLFPQRVMPKQMRHVARHLTYAPWLLHELPVSVSTLHLVIVFCQSDHKWDTVMKYKENFCLRRSPAFLAYYVFSAGCVCFIWV